MDHPLVDRLLAMINCRLTMQADSSIPRRVGKAPAVDPSQVPRLIKGVAAEVQEVKNDGQYWR